MNYRKFLYAVISNTELISFREAMRDDGGKESRHDEIRALEDNATWTLKELPPGKRALGSQWVYHIKYLCNDIVECLKSRFVVLGNHQKAGVDYNETFVPIAR